VHDHKLVDEWPQLSPIACHSNVAEYLEEHFGGFKRQPCLHIKIYDTGLGCLALPDPFLAEWPSLRCELSVLSVHVARHNVARTSTDIL
jgi:hypothetical protein